MTWSGYQQPSNWASIVDHIVRTQPCCQLRYAGCTGASITADHRTPVFEGGSHAESNLQGVCDACHTIKTKAEAARGRARAPRARRKQETHPGLA